MYYVINVKDYCTLVYNFKKEIIFDSSMIITDLTERQIKDFIEKKRPPLEIREKVDIGYSYKNNTLELFEIRPQWDDEKIIRQHPIAKVKYIKTKKVWKIYWLPSNLKWLTYKTNSEVKLISEVLSIIDEDIHGCFWG